LNHTKLKRQAIDKHSSLFVQSIIAKEKKFNKALLKSKACGKLSGLFIGNIISEDNFSKCLA
jgi:hypothetical protein